MSTSHDLTGLRRGNSFRRAFRFKDAAGDLVDLTGSVLVFVAEAGTARIRKSTEDGETRQFPVGRLRARYEIERRIEAEETTLVAGCITVMDGINDDSGDH